MNMPITIITLYLHLSNHPQAVVDSHANGASTDYFARCWVNNILYFRIIEFFSIFSSYNLNIQNFPYN